MSLMYGWTCRIGPILPSNNTVMEANSIKSFIETILKE